MLEDVRYEKQPDGVVVVTGKSFTMRRKRNTPQPHKYYPSPSGFRMVLRRVGDKVEITETGLFDEDAQVIMEHVRSTNML